MCSNDFGCPAQLQRYFEFFCSKDVMDIAGMGPSAIEVLIGAGLLEHIWDIYDLPDKISRIAALPGFGTKKAEKLAAEIEKSRPNPSMVPVATMVIPASGLSSASLLFVSACTKVLDVMLTPLAASLSSSSEHFYIVLPTKPRLTFAGTYAILCVGAKDPYPVAESFMPRPSGERSSEGFPYIYMKFGPHFQ